ncbi:MAG: ATP-binding cassette domain-containing protein [Candidatus Lokiarchaeota archaeon]|nr:ATP-binding cassette domain-containing protein [Candidatus Lokiarchaeota archaeon]
MLKSRKKKEIPSDFNTNYDIFMRDCSVSYDGKTVVLKDVSLDLKKGEILGLIGGSGAGKSTCMRVMTGQVKPLKGFIRTANCDVFSQRSLLVQKIGYVPQLEYLSLYYDFSALDNCVFFGRNYQLGASTIKKRAREIMKILGFENESLLKKPVKYLSGGEKKRVSIAVGLVNTPQILFLDEPTTGLDPHLRISVLNFLQKINKEYGTTMVIVSHDLEVADYCTRVAILNFGELVGFGKPKVLVESLPSNGQMLFAKFNQIDIRTDPGRIKEIEGVENVLLAGRNKLKVFVSDISNITPILSKISDLNLELKSFTIDSATFLDYFRIRGKSLETKEFAKKEK